VELELKVELSGIILYLLFKSILMYPLMEKVLSHAYFAWVFVYVWKK